MSKFHTVDYLEKAAALNELGSLSRFIFLEGLLLAPPVGSYSKYKYILFNAIWNNLTASNYPV